MSKTSKTFHQALVELLKERGPTHYKELVDEIIRRGEVVTSSKNVHATIRSVLSANNEFVRLESGIYGLRKLHAAKANDLSPSADDDMDTEEFIAGKESEQRVRTPHLPLYRETRLFLQVLSGQSKRQIRKMQAAIGKLKGTLKDAVDWRDPDTWIPERLSGDDRDLASTIWNKSGKTVNPRYLYGHWRLSKDYNLMEEDSKGKLAVTARGKDFIDHEGGETEVLIDRQEGIIKLLSFVADNAPIRISGLLVEWREYLKRCHSPFGSPTTTQGTLRDRLKNLLERYLITRKGTMYSLTNSGLEYLQREQADTEEFFDRDEQQELWGLVKEQEVAVRESLREILLNIDPRAFEYLIKHLLEEMGYQDVKVIGGPYDHGVDVIGEIELGITSICEAVQAKRHKNSIPRKTLDALRGVLHHFRAVRGTIVTTSRFSPSAIEAASEMGAAPITLIDGDRLIDLLIEHNIGVSKRNITLLTVDPDAFVGLEEEE